jgi:GH25 family lysozyme M1 (1,4-beta-N-acetylmuramidase)
MTDIRMADVSEDQVNVDAPTYLGASYACIICRTHNGFRADNMMPERRDYLRAQPFTAIGWYQYLVESRDAADQARDFIATVGTLRANEWPILDLEEGSGDQTGRAQAWFTVVDAWAGFPAMLYSFDSMLRDQLGGSAFWPGRPIWIAAWGEIEPSQAHTLWQFSEGYNFAGISSASDASVYHDTAEEFLSSVRGGVEPTPASAPGGNVFIREKNGDVYWFVASGASSYWRQVPAALVQNLPAAWIMDDPDGDWLKLWQVGA